MDSNKQIQIPPMASSSSSSTTSSLVESLFQPSLPDLIRHLRTTPTPPTSLLPSLRRELSSQDPSTQSTALLKLTFLSSLHHVPTPFALFPSLTLLPNPSFPLKRLAYLSTSLLLPPDHDLLLLIPNQLKKDLFSPLPQVQSLALSLLADLPLGMAKDLNDLLSTSNRSAVKRKAVLAVRRVFVTDKEDVGVVLRKLVECVEGSDLGVLSPAVGLFCEFVGSDPRPYLPLAPEFYRVLTECRNNWVLIKVLKVFGRLVAVEPRLGRKVVDAVCEHLRKSNAKSLVFECVRIVFERLDEYEDAVRLAVEKTGEFLKAEEDRNLRYLGLRALGMLKPRYSWAVEENRDLLMSCLGDFDPNIQREALRLVMGLVDQEKLMEITDLLVEQAFKSDPLFANEILGAILSTCGRDFYDLILDFDWYVAILAGMARNPHCAKGEEIESQLVDIALRVKEVRPELVYAARDLLIDPLLLGNPFLVRILSAAAWISGEFVEFSRNPFELVEALLQPRVNLLPALVRSVYIQAVFKIIVFYFGSYMEQIEASEIENNNPIRLESECDELEVQQNRTATKDPFSYESIQRMLNLVKAALSPLSECDEVEIQERARNVLGLIHLLQEAQVCNINKSSTDDTSSITEIVKLLQDVVSEDLGPIPPNSQDKIPVPDDLNLLDSLDSIDAIIGENFAESSSFPSFLPRIHNQGEVSDVSGPETTSLLAEHRKRHGIYYLSGDKNETEVSEYPRANEPQATEDLLEQTQRSLDAKKPKPLKPRPVVIKLDEEAAVPSSSTKSTSLSKDNSLSGAVHNILLGDEDEPSISKTNPSKKSHTRRGKDKEPMSTLKENLGGADQGNSSSKHLKRGHRKHKTSKENTDNKEGTSHRSSHRNSKNQDKHKHRQKGDDSLDVAPQAPVFQDFLL